MNLDYNGILNWHFVKSGLNLNSPNYKSNQRNFTLTCTVTNLD